MHGLARRLMFCALFLASTACNSAPRGRPTGDPDLIQRHQIVGGQFSTAHDVVRSLRPNWLVRRSSNGRNSPGTIWVYVDNNRYGDINQLRNVPAQGVGSIRRIDGITATTRWGTGHSEGVLYILSYVPARTDSTEN